MSVNNWNAVAVLDALSGEEVWVTRPLLLPSQALKITNTHASAANVISFKAEKYKNIPQFTFAPRNFGGGLTCNLLLKASFQAVEFIA